MADVNTFIDTIGKDVQSAVVPKIEKLTEGIEAQALSDYVPRISAFANQLVKEVIDEQSVVVRTFLVNVIQDLFQRYRPEVNGAVRARIVNQGIELTGQDVRIDLKNRETGALVSSLDIPIALKIDVDQVSVVLSDTTIGLDVVR